MMQNVMEVVIVTANDMSALSCVADVCAAVCEE
jgi:hypothetical protein